MEEMSLNGVIVKGDSKTVVDAINSSLRMESTLADYVQACEDIIPSCRDVAIIVGLMHLLRPSNFVAEFSISTRMCVSIV